MSDYVQAKAKRDALDAEATRLGRALKTGFPRSSMGLVSDEVRATPEYRKAKAESDAAFKALQNFNAQFTRRFAKEIRVEREAKKLLDK